jgi:hypothetical protein
MAMAAKKRAGWSFYAGWILSALVGVALALGIMYGLITIIVQVVGGTIVVNGTRRITEDFLATYLFIPALGLSLGLVQVAVLRAYLPRMGSWAVLTFAAFVLLLATLSLLRPLLPRLGIADSALQSVLPVTMYLLIGLALGAAQWLLLRRRVAGAGWWIVANLLGWGLVYPLVGNSWNNLVEMMMLGLVPGAVTAIVLGLLITRSAPLAPAAIA